MLKYELMRFISHFEDKNNIILKIFVKHFEEIMDILSTKDKYCLSNFISNAAREIINGKRNISDYEIVKLDTYDEKNRTFEENKLLDKLKISEVYINGIRGFGDISQECNSVNNDCYEKPNIVLEVKSKSKNVTATSALIFGWNGEGKSSFTESLEFALCGNVEEANRRNKKCNAYLLNANCENGFVKIKLIKLYRPPKELIIKRFLSNKSKGKSEIEVKGNEDLKSELEKNLEYYEALFSKCFIERNRIEEFILAKSSGMKEKYGQLVGLAELNYVITNCWKNADSQLKEQFMN